MNFDWILSPLTQYCVLALGFMSCMGLCFSTSIRMRAERRRMAKSQESLDQTVTALSTTVEQIRRDAPELETCSPAQLKGLNLTKRAHALRMHRRGESLATISAALQSPRNEIELLLKVHGYMNS
jgi:hypothetical protein